MTIYRGSGTAGAGSVVGSIIDASNVQITGGTIDDTLIGSVSPSTGVFTTLTTNTFTVNSTSTFTGAATFNGAVTLDDPTADTLTLTTSVFLTEAAAALADVAGQGQLWVRSDTPNTLVFTDDAGTDYDVAGSTVSSSVWTQSGNQLYYDGGAGTDFGLGSSSIVSFTGVATGVMIGDNSCITGRTEGTSSGWLDLMHNQFYNGTNHEYIHTGPATKVQIAGWDGGAIRVYMSASGTAGNNAETSRTQALLINSHANGATALFNSGNTSDSTAQIQVGVSSTGIGRDSTGHLRLFCTATTSQGPVFIQEAASAVADIANWGQVWVKNDTPNKLMFTDDAGMDIQLSTTNTNTQTGTTYTGVLNDAEAIITMNNASANTFTIPANASVAYPIGTTLTIMQLGAGATTVAITTDTLSYHSSDTAVLDGQYAVATAVKITATSWVLFGKLVAA